MTLILLLMGVGSVLAQNSTTDQLKLVQKHIEGIRNDRLVRQAARRESVTTALVRLKIAEDGSIRNVHFAKASISAELKEYVIRAFRRLPPMKNAPKPLIGASIVVVLRLGVD